MMEHTLGAVVADGPALLRPQHARVRLNNGRKTSMRYTMLVPVALFALAGCVDVHEHPAPQPSSTTYVTPAPTMPPPAYAPASTTTTVVRTP